MRTSQEIYHRVRWDARFDASRAAALGQRSGDGTPIMVTMPTSRPWVPLRILGLGSAAAGGVFYARVKLAERSEKIKAAESDVRSALDDLDPVARAQVLADVAKSQLP